MAKKSNSNRPTFTDQEALDFHSRGRPGKLEVIATKPMATQRDLSLAYSPGVAIPVLAIDDAGTGHSNLAYIHQLGVDVIKIDRMFVDMVKSDTQQVAVLDGLISMARDLGADIVAEGVETEVQAKYLRARGVVLAQGFLFAPALGAAAFKELAQALNGNSGVHEVVAAPAA
jgi:EAL domain-containing protein (putative c-di-GMP-specific phosphodiesterase class I)